MVEGRWSLGLFARTVRYEDGELVLLVLLFGGIDCGFIRGGTELNWDWTGAKRVGEGMICVCDDYVRAIASLDSCDCSRCGIIMNGIEANCSQAPPFPQRYRGLEHNHRSV